MDHPHIHDRLVSEIEAYFKEQAKNAARANGTVNAKELAERLQDIFVISIKGEVIDQAGPGDD